MMKIKKLIKEYFSEDHSELSCGISCGDKQTAIDHFKSNKVPNKATILIESNSISPSIKNYRALWGNNVEHLKTIPNNKLETLTFKEFKDEQ